MVPFTAADLALACDFVARPRPADDIAILMART
jgi:hypothetical protein